MLNPTRNSKLGVAARMLGLLLVALGGFFLLEEVFGLHLSASAWQFYVIVPGLILIIGASSIEGPLGETLAIVGGVIVGAGALLVYQEASHNYQSWAYTWALIVPGSAGLGQLIYGALRRQPGTVRSGLILTVAGIALCIVVGVGLAAVEGIGPL